MNGTIVISSIAVMISLLSLILSLVNYRRDKELKLFEAKTEILNKLTRAKMLSMNNSGDFREILNKVSKTDVITDQMLRIDIKNHQVDTNIDEIYSVAKNITCNTNRKLVESLLQNADMTLVTLESLEKDFTEMKKEIPTNQ